MPMLTRVPQRNNKLVWDETLLIMEDMFQNAWGDQDEIVLDHCVSITLQVRIFLSCLLLEPSI